MRAGESAPDAHHSDLPGRSATSPGVTQAALTIGSGRIVNIKPPRIGGIVAAMAIAACAPSDQSRSGYAECLRVASAGALISPWHRYPCLASSRHVSRQVFYAGT